MRGGPGETQIELDKRMIGDAIKRTCQLNRIIAPSKIKSNSFSI
jgi:50S ribosomal subunit-associated GTPase HflX